MEVHSRVVEARVAGHSLNALRRELVRNRYTRMYDTITAYYQHCEQDKHRKDPFISSHFRASRGATQVYPPMHPILHNPDAYFDHEPPSVAYMMDICDRFSESRMKMWTQYMQQITA